MSNTPCDQPLPRQIDPRKFAQQGIAISGLVTLSELSRVSEVLASDQGRVHAELAFGISEQRTLVLTGKIQAQLDRVCQRCLDAVTVEVSSELSLAILWDEDKAANLPKSIDPWVIGEGATDIYQIIEDELLLSLPIVSYHDYDCVPNEYFSSGKEQAQQVIEQAPKQNPFQVLERLKGSLSEPGKTDNET